MVGWAGRQARMMWASRQGASRRGCVCVCKCVHECAGMWVCVHELVRVRGACLRAGRQARVCVHVYMNE